MAYRFNGSTDLVEFALGPCSGYTFGAATWALLLKRNGIGSVQRLIAFSDSAFSTTRALWQFNSADTLRFNNGPSSSDGAAALTSTSVWYLLAVTRGSGSSTPRFHIYDGSSWVHQNGSTALADSSALVAGDRLRVGRGASSTLDGDVVCVGVKLGTSSDAAVEALSATAFSAWRSFGFDWLIGFDSSLVAGGLLQDQGAAGTGDELSRTGTTAVADPAGWSWGAAAPTFVPQVILT